MKILLGTKNPGKLNEIKRIFSNFVSIELLTYRERPFRDVFENGVSFRENALKKARAICAETRLPVLAEDSGLEVKALHGKPGVRSARFAGERATDRRNIEKLLELLKGVKNRRARFRCVAVLCFPQGQTFIAEGELRGRIAKKPKGKAGFGYDPVFIPNGYTKTLAELGASVKDKISHRKRALERLKLLIEHFQKLSLARC